MPTIFVSYRRQDSDASAGRLYDSLSVRLPDIRLFMDVDTIKGGDDFTKVLETNLSLTDVMLVVIGPSWATITKADGTRRIVDPNDFVALEVNKALAAGIPVVPVLLEETSMPSADELPPSLRELAKRQGFVLKNVTWKRDMDALVDRVEGLLAERPLQDGRGAVNNATRWRVLEPLMRRIGAWRRRIIPRSRTWRVVKQLLVLLCLLVAIAVGYASVFYVRTRSEREIDRLAADLRYERSQEEVVGTIFSLRELGIASNNTQTTTRVVARLKALVLNSTDKTNKGRAIRKFAIETIKRLRHNDLSIDFGAAELKESDLVEVDLSRALLKRVSFEDAFLIRTDFTASDLTGADLSGSFVRNADFAAATLTGANVDGLDWFNASGFDADQLRAVDLTTLTPCPKDDTQNISEDGFRGRLAKEYSFQWDQLGSDRSQLLENWRGYGKPGGLCSQVDAWLAAVAEKR